VERKQKDKPQESKCTNNIKNTKAMNDYTKHVMRQWERRLSEPEEDPRDRFDSDEEWKAYCEEMADREGRREAYEEDMWDEKRHGL
jgi:hypothetical protein